MHPEKLKIYNGNIITPYKVIEGGCILVTEGIITEVSERNIDVDDATEIDAGGKYVAPGFIDIHVHGGGGYDFMDATQTAFLRIAETHVQYGTTAMLPTTLTATKELLLQTLDAFESASRCNINGAQLLGMHLVGPYISQHQKGAQDARFIRDPNPDEYKEILSKYDCIKRWSAAPELNGAIEFGCYLNSKDILPAIAHTDAVYEEVKEAFTNGYSLITHLYSAMSGVTRKNAYRYAGVIESAYLIDDMDVEIIADGIHLPPPLLQLVYKIKGPDRIALITDAMRAAGTRERESILGGVAHGIPVIVEDGVAKLPDRSAFAGSVATANQLIKTMITVAGVSLTDAIKMITSTPARILKIEDKKGTLVRGKDADIVIFDDNISIETTIVRGKICFSISNGLHKIKNV